MRWFLQRVELLRERNRLEAIVRAQSYEIHRLREQPKDEHVVPRDLMYAPMWERIDWLLKDIEGDDMMLGVPRYQRRYTERESAIANLVSGGIRHPRYTHEHRAFPISDTPMSGRCAYCGKTLDASALAGREAVGE